MPREVDTMGVIKYLVLKRLAGKENYLRALYEYLTNNESPSELEYKYKINRRLIVSMKLRIREKNPIYGEEIVRRAIPIILKTPMPQLTLQINGEIHFYCRVCGREFRNIYPEDHIAKNHRVAVAYYTIIIKMQLKGWVLG
jgi:DNA-directed RNA polymerase subunit L